MATQISGITGCGDALVHCGWWAIMLDDDVDATNFLYGWRAALVKTYFSQFGACWGDTPTRSLWNVIAKLVVIVYFSAAKKNLLLVWLHAEATPGMWVAPYVYNGGPVAHRYWLTGIFSFFLLLSRRVIATNCTCVLSGCPPNAYFMPACSFGSLFQLTLSDPVAKHVWSCAAKHDVTGHRTNS